MVRYKCKVCSKIICRQSASYGEPCSDDFKHWLFFPSSKSSLILSSLVGSTLQVMQASQFVISYKTASLGQEVVIEPTVQQLPMLIISKMIYTCSLIIILIEYVYVSLLSYITRQSCTLPAGQWFYCHLFFLHRRILWNSFL